MTFLVWHGSSIKCTPWAVMILLKKSSWVLYNHLPVQSRKLIPFFGTDPWVSVLVFDTFTETVHYNKCRGSFRWKAESKPQEPLSSLQWMFFVLCNYVMPLKFYAEQGNWKTFSREVRCGSSTLFGSLLVMILSPFLQINSYIQAAIAWISHLLLNTHCKGI